jgi:hypothetical protein
MPIPWLTVLQAVPWSDVISNAPKVADGAKKLWKTIGKKSKTSDLATGNSAPATEPPSVTTLQARLDEMEATQAELHEQMLASSELIKALAEQNALLIGRAEMMRVRVSRLQAAVVVLTLITIAGMVLQLTH